MILIDAGPLLALVDPGDASHIRCTQIASRLPEQVITTWSCFTEAMYLAGREGGYRLQETLWGLRRDGLLQLHQASEDEATHIDALMATYRDIPMDIADASLIAAADALSIDQIFTIDSHFYAYRLLGGKPVQVIG